VTFWIALLLVVLHVVRGTWALLLIAGTAVLEVSQTLFWLRYSNRRSATVGAETLIGRIAEVAEECRPYGQVRIQGERWRAHCTEGAGLKERVRITGIDGLTLEVVRAE
jgi:membrane-bound serine protease (ClpP class)